MSFSSLDFTTSSDDALSDALLGLDGAWSRQTRSFLLVFKAERLDLNDNWAGVGPDWCCPSCHRAKRHLVRLSDKRVLLCQLERHHDHLRDHGIRTLRERNPMPDDEPGRMALMSAFKVCKGLFERFYDTVICKDCNSAEGQAKSALSGAPRDFSFSPAEITRFIVVRPNQPHEINLAAAQAVWEEVRDDALDRLTFAELLAERIALGRHRREGRTPPRPDAGRSAGELAIRLAREAGIDAYRLPSQLDARSVRRHGFGSSGAARPEAGRPPTASERAAFEACQFRTSGWLRADDTWQCPVCEREKDQILRQSKAGKWTGKLQDYVVFSRETDEENRWWRGYADEDELVFGSHRSVWLCQDCRQVLTDVKTRDPTLDGYALSVDDLRSLVTDVASNTRCLFDLEAALNLARNNTAFGRAADDYFAHRSQSVSRHHEYRAARRVLGLSPSDAFTWLVERLGLDGEDAFELERLVWQLDEGARLDAEDIGRPGAAASAGAETVPTGSEREVSGIATLAGAPDRGTSWPEL